MTDLLSMVVTVQPTETLTVPGNLARAVYALMLRWVDAHDAALAQRWHDADGPKPYTCSTLVGGRRTGKHERTLTAGKEYWFRITVLEPELAAVLLAKAQHPPRTVDLDGIIFPVTAVYTDAGVHPWARSTSYDALAGPYLLAREQAPRHVELEYVSPVTFRQNDLNVPMPLPDLVFGGLADRFNAFSPVAVSPEMRAYCQSSVAMSRFTLKSSGFPLKSDVVYVGSTGSTRYVNVRFDRYWASVLALLADFAFYAGVGRMTSSGMGQSRRTG